MSRTYREFGRLGKHLRIALLAPCVTPYLALGHPGSFTAYLDDLRVEHRRRPTFIAHLDAVSRP